MISTISHRQCTPHEGLNSQIPMIFDMDNYLLNGRSLIIKNNLSADQQDLLEQGSVYIFDHKVPTEKNKVRYLRATIKGIMKNSPYKVMGINGKQNSNGKALIFDKNLSFSGCCVDTVKINSKEAFFVQTTSNLAVVLPSNSKLMVIGKNYFLQSKSLESFKIGDRIAVMKRLPTGNADNLSVEKARFLMLMLGDGHVTKRRNRIFITSSDSEILENFSELTQKIYGKKAKILKPNAELNSVKVCAELANLGFMSKDKYATGVPSEILQSGEEILFSTLGALIDTDGNIFEKKGQIRVDTASYSIALDIATLFLKIGLFPTINRTKTTFGVRAQIYGRVAKRISDYVISKRKKQNLLSIKDPKKSLECELLSIEGTELAFLRKSNLDTLDSLSKKIGVNPKLINNWEKNKRKVQIKKLQQIAEIYDNQNLLNLVSSPITTVKIKDIEKINFDQGKDFIMPKTEEMFISNLILTKGDFYG